MTSKVKTEMLYGPAKRFCLIRGGSDFNPRRHGLAASKKPGRLKPGRVFCCSRSADSGCARGNPGFFLPFCRQKAKCKGKMEGAPPPCAWGFRWLWTICRIRLAARGNSVACSPPKDYSVGGAISLAQPARGTTGGSHLWSNSYWMCSPGFWRASLY